MSSPISTSDTLNDKVVLAEYIAEYTNQNPFKPFMGKLNSGKAIVVKQQDKGKGDTIVFGNLPALSNSSISGSSRLSGNEERQTTFNFSVVLDREREGVQDDEVDFTQLRTPLALREAMRPQLVDLHAQHVATEIVTALSDETAGRNQDRYLYGAAEANYNATHATALANVDATTDVLSVEHIQLLKLKAATPSSSPKIRPMKVTMDNGMKEDFFVYFAHPTSVMDLKQSTTFKEMAYRGGLQEGTGRVPSLMNGSRLVAMLDNVIVYQIDELTQAVESGAGASSIDVAHNMLCGANAIAYGQGMLPRFTEEKRDHEGVYALGMTEFRKIDKIVFNSIDNGVIHSFVSAAS